MAKKGDWIHCNVAHRVGTTMQSHKYNIMAKEFISLFYMWRLCKYKYGYERNPPPPHTHICKHHYWLFSQTYCNVH